MRNAECQWRDRSASDLSLKFRFPRSAFRTVKRKSPPRRTYAGFRCEAGGGLLSHDLAVAVPSALTGLTTVFGMGTGVALSR